MQREKLGDMEDRVKESNIYLINAPIIEDGDNGCEI